MPRIGQITFRSSLDYESPTFTIQILYGRKRKQFYADLPEEVHEALSDVSERLWSDTEEGVDRKIRNMCREWWEAQKSMERVIVYNFKANAVIENPDKNEHGYAPPIWKAEDIFHGINPMLGVSFKVCFKLTLPSGSYSFVNDKRKSAFRMSNDMAMTYMPWTQESEDFFVKFTQVLHDTAYQIHLFLDQEPEVVALAIQEASGRLPFFKEGKI